MDEKTTKKLADILSQIENEIEMQKYMKHHKVTDSFKSFVDYYKSLSAVKKLSDSELIKLSGVEKSYYYQIMKGTRNPSRDKVLRLCIGAGLTTEETTRALELNECAILYPMNKRDIIISVAINQHASVMDTNLLLDKYGEKPLS